MMSLMGCYGNRCSLGKRFTKNAFKTGHRHNRAMFFFSLGWGGGFQTKSLRTTDLHIILHLSGSCMAQWVKTGIEGPLVQIYGIKLVPRLAHIKPRTRGSTFGTNLECASECCANASV